MATNAPILQYYDPSKPLTLSVDASSKGLGAVLIQNQRPVAYASKEHLRQLNRGTLKLRKRPLQLCMVATNFMNMFMDVKYS